MCQICLMVAAISETDSGCSTAIGWYWYLLPKSLAAWLRLTSSKLKCPPRGRSALSEEGALERQKLSLMAMQLRNKIVKPLRNIMLCSLTRLNGGDLILEGSSNSSSMMVVEEGIIRCLIL